MRDGHRTIIVLLGSALLGASPPGTGASPRAVSSWVFVGSDNRLHYKTDAQGNRIIDFSSAGYEGGGVALPTAAVSSTVTPVTGDNTAAIQAAIDAVAKAPPGAGGLRGAVLLAPGTFDVSGTLNLDASGVVLRGSGSATGGTILNMTGSPHLMLSIAGSGGRQTAGAALAMTDAYVPSGAVSFNVSDGSTLEAGDAVVIGRPVTQPWVHLMGMDTLTSNGAAQTWIGVGSIIQTDRVIAAVSGNNITLDAPLADSFDATYLAPPGGTVTAFTFPGRISGVGVEHLQVVAPAVDVIISSPQFTGAELDAVADAWLEDLVFQDTQNTITVSNTAKQVTIDDVHVAHTLDHTGDRMADFGLSGTQILVNKSSSNGTGEWPLLTQGEVSGPIVALSFSSTEQAGIGPHQRWAVGLLADNATLPNAPNNSDGGATGISYSDRGDHGSGQGWAMGWGVAWNVTTPFFVVQQPPGAQNWCIGCIGATTTAVEAGSGKAVPNGIFESSGVKVTPNSLYLAQLCDRLGAAALVNIGYTGSDCAVPGASTGAADGGSTSGTPPPTSGSGGSISSDDASASGAGGAGGASNAGDDAGGSSAGAASGSDGVARGGCACTTRGSAETKSREWSWLGGLLALGALSAGRRRARTR